MSVDVACEWNNWDKSWIARILLDRANLVWVGNSQKKIGRHLILWDSMDRMEILKISVNLGI